MLLYFCGRDKRINIERNENRKLLLKKVRISTMKKLLLRAICLLIIQLTVAWLLSMYYFKREWNFIAFMKDPAIITFWVVYISILIFKYHKNK